MSRGSRSSLIPVAVFVAILLILLPVSAGNVTLTSTTAAANVTTAAINETAVATTLTTVPPTQTTVATNQTTVTTALTTAPTTKVNATPVVTTVTVTRPTTVVTTVIPATPGTTAVTTGSIIVHSSPTGASVLIDGTYSGTTPKIVSGVPAGNHILRLSLSGYHDYEGSIYVVAGQTAQGYGTLQPIDQVMSAAPTPTVVPVIVPVIAVTAEPTQDPGLLGNSSVIVAIIGIITALIAAGVSVFTHVKPPKKE